MGESVDCQDKMEETVLAPASSNPGLEVSVSFGRFENDSLSWEKFSTFSPNKYLEEVEKCATPGSVAQKKAYFEAHYKKIAERKAELMDQEKQAEKKAFSSSSSQSNKDPSSENCRADSEISVSNGQCSYEEDKHVTDLASEVHENLVEEPDAETKIVTECQSSLIEGVIDQVGGNLDGLKLEPEELVPVKEEEEKEEIPLKRSEDNNEIPLRELEKGRDSSRKTKNQSVKKDHTKASPKVKQVNKKTITSKTTPISKERKVAPIKKKPVSPATKTPGFSTPKVSKPASTVTSTSMSCSLIKKENVSTLSRSKNPPAAGNKQIAPKSLHMSLSLGTPSSDPASLMTTRKSLIMERMGDKDIVKRAFKTFQKSYNQLKSSSDGQTAVTQQVPAKATRASSLVSPRKESGGSLKAVGLEKRSAKATSSSFGSKSEDRLEKRKELSKNVGEKPNARVAERMRVQTRPKEGGTDVKNQKHSLDSKAKPMSGVHLGQKLPRGPSDKVGSKNEAHR